MSPFIAAKPASQTWAAPPRAGRARWIFPRSLDSLPARRPDHPLRSHHGSCPARSRRRAAAMAAARRGWPGTGPGAVAWLEIHDQPGAGARRARPGADRDHRPAPGPGYRPDGRGADRTRRDRGPGPGGRRGGPVLAGHPRLDAHRDPGRRGQRRHRDALRAARFDAGQRRGGVPRRPAGVAAAGGGDHRRAARARGGDRRWRPRGHPVHRARLRVAARRCGHRGRVRLVPARLRAACWPPPGTTRGSKSATAGRERRPPRTSR